MGRGKVKGFCIHWVDNAKRSHSSIPGSKLCRELQFIPMGIGMELHASSEPCNPSLGRRPASVTFLSR